MSNSNPMVTFGSVCSGIEAASVAWRPLGWEASWLSEIEKFPSAVLAHHYPDTPNLGDMTKIAEKILSEKIPAPDVLVGGTPCQAFSVAGMREGLADPRGELTIRYVELADAIDTIRHQRGEQPAIIVWENVPGVLSSKDNAFGCFLGALAGESSELQPAGKRWGNAGCVYGPKRAIAWRVLDAQYFGLAQRRKRVFLAASARDGFDPAKVLFEFEGVRRDTAPSRTTEEKTALSFAVRTANTSSNGWGVSPDGPSYTLDSANGQAVVTGYRMVAFGEYAEDETASTMKARDHKDATGLVCSVHGTQDPIVGHERAHALGRNNGAENAVHVTGLVRRLTPIECERLQGFPEVKKRCTLTFYNNAIFDICFIDQLNINVLADQRYHKSPSSALTAEEKELKLPAKYVVQSLNASQAELEKPALVNVRIDLERNLLLIHNQEKSLLSVKIADKKKWCPLPIQTEDFARLCVATLTALERKAPTGREGSQASTKNSTHQSSGEKFASLCGLEIGDHAEDVQKFTKKATECMKYITSEAGQSSRNSEQILQTLLYCVTTAINSFIQEKTHLKSSYVLNIEITSGYTQIPWRDNPATECPDGHRYKALGNSMAVPCMIWIGSRVDRHFKGLDK